MLLKAKKVFPQIKFIFDNSAGFLGMQYRKLSPGIQLNRIKIYFDNDRALEPHFAIERNIYANEESGLMTLMDKDNMSLIKSIANSKSPVIRFYGRSYYDFKLTDSDKKQLKLVVQALEDINSQ